MERPQNQSMDGTKQETGLHGDTGLRAKIKDRTDTKKT